MKAFTNLAFVLSFSISAAEELPKWLADIYPEKLPSGIHVEMSSSGESAFAVIANGTKLAISYQGYEASRPRIYNQTRSENGWSTPSCHWCATGLRTFTIAPGSTQRFILPKATETRRIFTLFYVQDSRMGGLIPTATGGESGPRD